MSADPSSRSAQLYERACKVMVSGNTRATVFSSPHQIYAASASGCWIFDVDGVERIDYQNNYSVLIHGHAHPAIVESVERQLGKGFCYGLATRLANLGQMARERITEAFRAAGIPGQATGLGSLFRIHFTDRRFTNYGDFYPLPVEKSGWNGLSATS